MNCSVETGIVFSGYIIQRIYGYDGKDVEKTSDGLGILVKPFVMAGYENYFSDSIFHFVWKEILKID